jgi:hypothetical protein
MKINIPTFIEIEAELEWINEFVKSLDESCNYLKEKR